MRTRFARIPARPAARSAPCLPKLPRRRTPREHATYWQIQTYGDSTDAPHSVQRGGLRMGRCATSAQWAIDWPKTRGRRKMKTEKRDKVRQTVPHSLLRAENRSLVRGMASDNNTPLAAKTATNECQECHFWHRPVPALFNRQTISTTGIREKKTGERKMEKSCVSFACFVVPSLRLLPLLRAQCSLPLVRKPPADGNSYSHPPSYSRPTLLLQSYSNPTRVLLTSYSPPTLGKMPKTREKGRKTRDYAMNKTRRKKVGRKRRDMHQIGRQRGEVNRGFHGEHGCFQEIPNGGTSVNLSAKICVIRGSSLPTAEQLRFFLTGCPRRPGRYYWTMFVSPSKLNLFREGA